MQNIATDLSPAEWSIMRIIWTLGKASSTEVIQQMQAKRDWSESTIKTLLRRLIAKSALSTEKEGRHFIYHPTISEKVAMEATTSDLFDQMCDMKKGTVILDLIDQVPLSQSDIKQMQGLLTEKLKNAPVEVKCNCLPDSLNSDNC